MDKHEAKHYLDTSESIVESKPLNEIRGWWVYRHPRKSFSGIRVRQLVDDLKREGYKEGSNQDFNIGMDGNEVVLKLNPTIARVASSIAGRHGLVFVESVSGSHVKCDEGRDFYGLRDDKGNLPAYAWPGGYPLYYLTADNGVLCADCANSKEAKQAQADYPDDDQWRIVAHDANWEDPNMYCDNCNKRIESAYADDEVEESVGHTFKVGDKVVTKKMSRKTGTIVYIGSGPMGDMVSVLWDNPVQKILGAQPVDPKTIVLMSDYDDGYFEPPAPYGPS